MNFLSQALSYIFTTANWGGRAGLLARIGEHLQYTIVAVAVSERPTRDCGGLCGG